MQKGWQGHSSIVYIHSVRSIQQHVLYCAAQKLQSLKRFDRVSTQFLSAKYVKAAARVDVGICVRPLVLKGRTRQDQRAIELHPMARYITVYLRQAADEVMNVDLACSSNNFDHGDLTIVISICYVFCN